MTHVIKVTDIDIGAPTFAATYTVEVDGVEYTVEQVYDKRTSSEDWLRDGTAEYPLDDDEEWSPEENDSKVQEFWRRYTAAVETITYDVFGKYEQVLNRIEQAIDSLAGTTTDTRAEAALRLNGELRNLPEAAQEQHGIRIHNLRKRLFIELLDIDPDSA